MFYFLPATLTHHMKELLCLLFLMTFCIGTGSAQVRNMAYTQIQKYDSTYYVSYETMLTTRFYFSKKYTSLKFRDFGENYNVTYRPNTTLNMGVGATYKSFTLNLAYGFGFLNPERGKGETKYLDLQFHTYTRRFVIDMFGQFYRGFFLTHNSTNSPNTEYYLRPDLSVNQIGASVQYILNHRKFSYRASFLQSEWQKKSAGTFIFGLEAYGGKIEADSTIIPTVVNTEEAKRSITELRFFEFGPNAGYAYTLVIKKHFFLTASASISLDFGQNTVFDQSGTVKSSGMSPNSFFRVFGGYNSSKWAISIIYVTNSVRLSTESFDRRTILNTGNFRINYVYRFELRGKMKRFLEKVEEG